MIGEELDCFGPQCGKSLGIIIEGNGEAICLVVIMHVSEDIVVDVAKEVNFGLDSPVVAGVLERRVLVK